MDITLREVLEQIIDFITGGLGELLALLFGFFAPKLYQYVRSGRPFRRVWDMKKNQRIYIVNGTIESESAHETYMKSGDTNALASVLGTMKMQFPDSQVERYLSTNFPDALMDRTVISIGGPVWNRATKLALERFNWPYYFDESWALIDRQNTQKYEIEKNQDGEITKDYGIFMKGPNPLNPRRKVFIIAGISTYGVLAAARVCSSVDGFDNLPIHATSKKIKYGWKPLNHLRRRFERAWHKGCFALLIRVDVLGSTVTNPEIESFYNIPLTR